MNLLVKLKFGSHLYGTNTVDSDTDIKGVFLPSPEECFLNRIPKCFNSSTGDKHSKNTKDDIDTEIFSLQYFLEMGYRGDTIFLDMIHCSEPEVTSPVWEFIRQNRSKFYTTNLKSYVGYCRTQCAKYGVKASRLYDAKNVLDFLVAQDQTKRLSEVEEFLPAGEHIRKFASDTVQSQDKRIYEVCNKKIMYNTKISEAVKMIDSFYSAYGHRAKQAMNNENIDWKAVSHAFRVGYQLKELYETGDIKFPLACADYLRDIKTGKLHFSNDNISEKLDLLISEVSVLAENSTYPDKVDRKFWDDYICSIYMKGN